MNAAAIHAEGLAELQAEMGDACPSVTWNAKSYNCLCGSGRLGASLTFGGFAPEIEKEIIILPSLFGKGPFPGLKQTLVYNPTGQQYRIEQIIQPQGEQQIHYGLVSAAKGVNGGR